MLAVCLLAAGCGRGQAARRVIVPELSADDRAFVIAGRQSAAALRPSILPPIHPQEEWWPYRAGFLGISERQAKERDAAVSERHAPAGFWDEQTAIESLHLWTALCNECHGGRRLPEDLTAMPAPSPSWGRGEGVFFGKLRAYSEMFAVVYNGAPDRDGKPSEMPAWRGKIAKEQIWAVLYFLEYQSGGMDGPVPPSLRPRRGAPPSGARRTGLPGDSPALLSARACPPRCPRTNVRRSVPARPARDTTEPAPSGKTGG